MIKLVKSKAMDLENATSRLLDGLWDEKPSKHEARLLIESTLLKYAVFELERMHESIQAIFEKGVKP